MSEFTIILEHMGYIKTRNGEQLVQQERSGDVIEAEDINQAWELARTKYYKNTSEMLTQIADIKSGNIEVDPAIHFAKPPPDAVAITSEEPTQEPKQ